jgi:amiloride-sensitive sodium channel
LKNLELASYICEKNVSEELNHSPLLNDDFDFAEFVQHWMFYTTTSTYWFNIETNFFFSITLTEDGLCFTFNPIKANSIFRNDTVDPVFFKQYEPYFQGTETKNWDMKNGYTLKTMKNYPLRALEKGAQNGLKLYRKVLKHELTEVDTTCRKDPRDVKVAVHHPAEVVSNRNSFVTVPFNKSFTFLLRPSITKSSESLRSYDPAV